jgi:hypothetical protein
MLFLLHKFHTPQIMKWFLHEKMFTLIYDWFFIERLLIAYLES